MSGDRASRYAPAGTGAAGIQRPGSAGAEPHVDEPHVAERLWREVAPVTGPRVDVIGIGVQKAATTWLFQCLREHPGVSVADLGPGWASKELHFFNHNWERGYGWYHRGFDFGRGVTIEYSTQYFHARDVPARIHAYNPGARFLLAIRDPIERAYSQHKHEARRGRVPVLGLEFGAALALNPSYVEHGRYATHLERWLEFFDLDRFHIVEYAEVRRDPEGTLRRVYEFCGVSPDFRPESLHARVNVPRIPRSRGLTRALRLASSGVRAVLGEEAHEKLRWLSPAARLRRHNSVELSETHVPPPTEEDRRRLAGIFEPEISRLEEMLGRDLSHWR